MSLCAQPSDQDEARCCLNEAINAEAKQRNTACRYGGGYGDTPLYNVPAHGEVSEE